MQVPGELESYTLRVEFSSQEILVCCYDHPTSRKTRKSANRAKSGNAAWHQLGKVQSDYILKKNKKTPLTGAGCQIKNCRFPISFAVQAVDYE